MIWIFSTQFWFFENDRIGPNFLPCDQTGHIAIWNDSLLITTQGSAGSHLQRLGELHKVPLDGLAGVHLGAQTDHLAAQL